MKKSALLYASVPSLTSTSHSFQVVCFIVAGERQAERVRCLYFQALLRQEIGWYDCNSAGALTSRISADVPKIQEAISDKVGRRKCIWKAGSKARIRVHKQLRVPSMSINLFLISDKGEGKLINVCNPNPVSCMYIAPPPPPLSLLPLPPFPLPLPSPPFYAPLLPLSRCF